MHVFFIMCVYLFNYTHIISAGGKTFDQIKLSLQALRKSLDDTAAAIATNNPNAPKLLRDAYVNFATFTGDFKAVISGTVLANIRAEANKTFGSDAAATREQILAQLQARLEELSKSLKLPAAQPPVVLRPPAPGPDLRPQLEKLTKDLKTANDQNKTLQEAIKQLQSQLLAVQSSQKDTGKQNVQTYLDQLKANEVLINDLRQQIQKLQQEIGVIIVRDPKEVDALHKQLEALRAEAEKRLQEQQKKYEADFDALELKASNDLLDQRRDHENLQANLAKELADLQAKLAAARNELETADKDRNEQAKLIKAQGATDKQIAQLQKAYEDLQKQLQASEAQLIAQQKASEAANKKAKADAQQNEQLQQQLEQSKAETHKQDQNLKRNIDELNKKLEAAHAQQINALADAQKISAQQIEDQRKTYKDSIKKYEDQLQQQLAASKAQADANAKDKEQHIKDMNALKAELDKLKKEKEKEQQDALEAQKAHASEQSKLDEQLRNLKTLVEEEKKQYEAALKREISLQTYMSPEKVEKIRSDAQTENKGLTNQLMQAKGQIDRLAGELQKTSTDLIAAKAAAAGAEKCQKELARCLEQKRQWVAQVNELQKIAKRGAQARQSVDQARRKGT